MKVRVCSKCGKHNTEDAWNCMDCGETLSMETLMDINSGQFPHADPPLAGQTTLSEISVHFEQDVTKTLSTTIRPDETTVWGCNYAEPWDNPPFYFGYLIITSRQLVCIRFVSDIKQYNVRDHTAEAPDGTYFEKTVFESTHPWILANLPKVPYPSQPLTPTEERTRTVIANDLTKITSVRLMLGWHEGHAINSVLMNFGKDNESKITFYAPHQGNKTYQLLKAQLDNPP